MSDDRKLNRERPHTEARMYLDKLKESIDNGEIVLVSQWSFDEFVDGARKSLEYLIYVPDSGGKFRLKSRFTGTPLRENYTNYRTL